ncbi:hypothetical protein GCM10012280_27150 [Wenjunlia tyrosinilytica]|uniref:exo-alpha-sialidase n=1 Tax=Wenjunlia tyrosinilytica TaxID=1544741 RepID=A0A917ZP36_9ACTN|nr:hypothetical protein GCM10012280_27150 [Wenjunlia tyrosinilytica]
MSSVPFVSGTGGYHTFRIPAVVRVSHGRPAQLLAFAEGRRFSAVDDGDIDVVERRSTDGGCTWGPLRVVTDAGEDTAGNPTPVVIPGTRTTVLLTCRTIGRYTPVQVRRGVAPPYARRVYVQTSEDAGASWSRPRDLTASVKDARWLWYATGPGHAIALGHGRHRGRLLAPANHSWLEPDPDGNGMRERHGAHSLYSDDGGRTWAVGYLEQPPGEELHLNETTFAELPGGLVYANTRNEYGSTRVSRADTYLFGGGTRMLGPYRPRPDLVGPVVEASTLYVGHAPFGRQALLFSAPAHPTKRARMTVRVSDDAGATWRAGLEVSPERAGYSDLVRLDRSTVGLLYETGPTTYHDSIVFRRIALSELGGP